MVELIKGFKQLVQYPAPAATTKAEFAKSVDVPITHKMVTVKNLAQSIQGVLIGIGHLPRLIRLIPTDVEKLAGCFEWVSALKTSIRALGVIKDIGNCCEFPERAVDLIKRLREEPIGLKTIAKIGTTAYIGMDLFLVPVKYGLFAASTGAVLVVGIVRDSLTACSATLNAIVEKGNENKARAQIQNLGKKVEQNGALDSLKALIDAKQPVTPELLDKLNQLKDKHWKTEFGKKKDKTKVKNETKDALDGKNGNEGLIKKKEKLVQERAKASDAISQAKIENEIQALETQITEKREKLARIEVWSNATTATNLDKLNQVVTYKIAKNRVQTANQQMNAEKSVVTRWYYVSKAVVVVFVNLGALGAAVALAPVVGISAVTLSSVFFLGQWISGTICGFSGLGRCFANLKYGEHFENPQTNLLRA